MSVMIKPKTPRTAAQNNKFHALVTKLGFDAADKLALVQNFTNGRETSSGRMYYSEMAAAIELLEAQANSSIKRMRSKIINIFKDIINVDEMTQPDWDKLNTFLIRNYGKPIKDLGSDELPKAVTSLEQWRKWGTDRFLNWLLTE